MKITHEAPKARMLRFHPNPMSLLWGTAWASEQRSILGDVNEQAGFKTTASLAPLVNLLPSVRSKDGDLT